MSSLTKCFATSDHCPLVCTSQTKYPTPNTFKIENAWLRVDSFKQLVHSVWQAEQTAEDPNQLSGKFKNLTKEIIIWKKEHVQAVKYQNQLCMDCIAWLTVQAELRNLTAEERLLKQYMVQRLNQIILLQEEKWRQRAKKSWVQLGDKNTKYFHHVATHKKRRN